MPADWTIDHWPVCGSHAFLSHVAEDRETLVLPVLEKLQSHKVICWLDQLHYPTGRDSHDALREQRRRRQDRAAGSLSAPVRPVRPPALARG